MACFGWIEFPPSVVKTLCLLQISVKKSVDLGELSCLNSYRMVKPVSKSEEKWVWFSRICLYSMFAEIRLFAFLRLLTAPINPTSMERSLQPFPFGNFKLSLGVEPNSQSLIEILASCLSILCSNSPTPAASRIGRSGVWQKKHLWNDVETHQSFRRGQRSFWPLGRWPFLRMIYPTESRPASIPSVWSCHPNPSGGSHRQNKESSWNGLGCRMRPCTFHSIQH